MNLMNGSVDVNIAIACFADDYYAASPTDRRGGWPWTDGSPWLWISFVTPSFKQGAFAEETIRCLLLQSHPDLQYIVMDEAAQTRALTS